MYQGFDITKGCKKGLLFSFFFSCSPLRLFFYSMLDNFQRNRRRWAKMLSSLIFFHFLFSSDWLRSHLSFFYHSERKFTMVNGFFNLSSFCHFTMVNANLVCCVSNSSRMKAKFTIAKPREKACFIEHLSKLCLFRWHLVMNFEKYFVTLLNLRAPTTHVCFLSPSCTIIFELSISSGGFLRLWIVLCNVRQNLKSFFHDENMTGLLYISSNHPCGLEYTHPTRLRLAKALPPSFLQFLNSGRGKSIGETALPPFKNKVKSQNSKSLSRLQWSETIEP